MLVLLAASFAAFAVVFVPRLTNAHFGDVEFTGWSGPVAEHVARGERPYVDFVLPIPHGSFAILAFIQRAMGRSLLLQELWLGTAIQLVLALLGYTIARSVTTRLNAILVSVCTLVTLINMYKECAYDHTAQLFAWSSIATGARALLAPEGRTSRRFWFLTGALAALTLAFKQSTGVGIVAGWGGAQLYLAAFERLSGQRTASRWLVVAAHFCAGVALGVALGIALLWAMDGSLAGYVQSVMIDGPALKGGRAKIIGDMIRYLAIWPSFPPTLFFAVGLALAGLRIAREAGSFHVGSELGRRDAPIARREALLAGAAIVSVFIGAALLLKLGVVIPEKLAAALDLTKYVPHFGLTFSVIFVLAHLRRVGAPGPSAALDPERAGHALNALLLAALACSFLHNTSAPEFRPFYDNNPLVPLGYAMLFIALDRGRMPALKAAVVVLALSSLFSSKLARASEAHFAAKGGTHWQGLYVSERGRTMEGAADRVRELTTPADTVLVLPEDVTFARRIGRARPALRGAIVFVDQYPLRLVDADIAELDRNPPKVVVVHPADDHYWTQMYRIWSGDSGAERVTRHVLRSLPKHYTRVENYSTRWYGRGSRLEVWVRKAP